jgi:hypothetical protein
MKYHMALGNDSPGPEKIKSSIQAGTEDQLRNYAANNEYLKDKAVRASLMGMYAAQRPEGELQPGEREFLDSLSTAELHDSKTVFEKLYGNKVVTATMADSVDQVQEAVDVNASAVDAAHKASADSIAKGELWRALAEEADAMSDTNTWYGLYSTAKTFIPFRSWYGETNLTPDDVKSDSFFKGDSIANQVQILKGRTVDENSTIIADIRKRMQDGTVNPADVAAFAKAAQGYSYSDRWMGNFSSGVDALDLVPGIGVSGSIISGVGKGALRFGTKIAAKRAVVKGIAEAEAETAATAIARDAPRAQHIYGASYDPNTGVGYTINGQKFNVVEKDSIKSSKSGREVGARVVYRNEANGVSDHVIEINPKKIAQDFQDKAWTKPKVEGVKVFPEDAFKTEQEWKDFVIHHEAEHLYVRRAEGQSLAEYENLINERAMKKFKVENSKAPPSNNTFGKEVVDPKTGNVDIVDIPDTPENRVAAIADAGVDNAERNTLDPVAIHTTNGRLNQAAAHSIIEDASGMKLSTDEKTLFKRMGRVLDGFFNPERRIAGVATNMSNRAKENMLAALANSRNAALRALFEGAQANRISIDQLERMMPEIQAEVRRQTSTPQNAILETKWGSIHESTNIEGVNYIEYGIGKSDGTMFGSRNAADDAAVNLYGLEPGTYKIITQGSGSFIKMRKAIDEVAPKFRDMLLDANTTAPVRTHTLFSRFLASGDTFVSDAAKKARLVATHQASKIHDAMYNAAKDIGQISKREATNLEAILEMNRDTEFGVAGTSSYQRGFWYDNVGAFEQAYKRMFPNDGFPSEKVTRAYFTYRNLMDADYLARNMRLYREKSRLGFNTFNFAIPVAANIDGTTEKTMQMMGHRVEGKFVDDIIQDGTDKRILIIDNENVETHYVRSKSDGMALPMDYQAKGYKMVMLANPNVRPLMNLTGNDNLIQYVLVKNFETRPMDFVQIPYRPGGHVVVSANWKVSQPRIVTTSDGSRIHVGDNHFTFVSSRKEAQVWAERMETARKMLVAGDYKALGKYITDKNLPYNSLNEFIALFEPRVVDGEQVEATFLKDSPFVEVADADGTNDAAKTYARDRLSVHFNGVEDTLDMPENLYKLIDKEFAGTRNEVARTVVQNGPDWAFEKARHLSPMQTLQDSISRVMRSTALDNYQTHAAENFVEQYADTMLTPKDVMRQNVLEHLMNPDWNPKADPVRLAAAKANRMATIQFLGMRDPTASALDWVKDKLLDSVYNAGGKARADWVDAHLLPYVKDPSVYLRSVGFHLKLGLFNPQQLFINSQTMFHAMAISGDPKAVMRSTAATTLMSAGRMTERPEVLFKIAQISTKFGWKANEFKEMWAIYKEQGIGIVGGEVGSLDNIFAPKVFTGAVGKFLDKGTMFFQETERAVRANAWALAYQEFRKANPTKVINADDIASMMRRSDTLSVNMTRASNAAWQHGVFSIPAQFSGYQARIMQQMLGKELTLAEKARVFTMYSALYGLPVGVGATGLTAGYPVGEDIRQAALARGIKLDEGATGLLMNGMINAVLKAATGSDYNVGQRVGPGGLEPLRQMLNGDKTAWQIIGGPSATIVSDVMSRAFPAIHDILTLDINSLKQVDFMNSFQEVSTVSNVTKLYYALQAHKLLSKNGTPLGHMNTQEAWIMAVTGLTPQHIADAYTKLNEMKDMKAIEADQNKAFLTYFRKALELKEGSPERRDLIAKAKSFMINRDPTDTNTLMMQAFGNKTVEDTANEQFAKGGPTNTRQDRKNLTTGQ